LLPVSARKVIPAPQRTVHSMQNSLNRRGYFGNMPSFSQVAE
jgi:hypothetical protein